MSLTLGAALGLGAASAGVSSLFGIGQNLLNQQASDRAFEREVQASKDLLDYQQSKYYSPSAQVKNLTKAGLNPASMFGNQSPVFSSGGMPSSPAYQNLGMSIGTQSLSELASSLVGLAQAKKAGVDTTKAEHEIEGIKLDNDAKDFSNKILKTYGLEKASQELALAYQQVSLAKQQGDINEQEKALKTWQTAKEKALSECSAHQRDLLKKELDNKDLALDIANREGESRIVANKAGAASALATAENQREQAETARQLRPLQVDSLGIENGLKAVDFDIKSATSRLSKVEFFQRVLSAISENRQGTLATKIFGASNITEDDLSNMSLDELRKACDAVWEKYKYGVEQGKRKVEEHKRTRQ